jgi:hypothetical protein
VCVGGGGGGAKFIGASNFRTLRLRLEWLEGELRI